MKGHHPGVQALVALQPEDGKAVHKHTHHGKGQHAAGQGRFGLHEPGHRL